MLKYEGVLPSPTGSELHRNFGINNGNPLEVFGSERGLDAIKQIALASFEAGATIGVAYTFRLTEFRASKTGWDFLPNANFQLHDQYLGWNTTAVDIARKVYQNALILGSVAPTTNTSKSEDDKKYTQIGKGSELSQVEFSFQRQDPQIAALAEAGVDGITVEACRFRNDALGIAQSVRKHGIKLLVVSFEADERGFPDPSVQDGYSFHDMRLDLEKAVGQGIEVRVGVNCTGAMNIERILAQNIKLDTVYPNQVDYSQGLSEAGVKQILALCNEAPDHLVKESIRQLMYRELESSFEELKKVWTQALNSGAQVIGICCGGTPEHVALARKIYDAHCLSKAS